jgi:hypothetical protein
MQEGQVTLGDQALQGQVGVLLLESLEPVRRLEQRERADP